MHQPKKIIIADDHPLFRQALKVMLSAQYAGVTLLEAESIEQLEPILQSDEDSDVLLLDLNIPGAQGFSSLIKINKQYPNLPLIVVSGYEDTETISQAISHGALGYIPKSTSVDDMKVAIADVLSGERWLPAFFELPASDEVNEAHQKIATLTPQQHKILLLFADGLLNKQIAYELGLSEATVKSHASAIFLKLGVRNRTQAVIMLNQLRIASPAFGEDNN